MVPPILMMTSEVQAPSTRGLAPEAAALIQRIVDRIVDAVQVRMYASGATEVHMELNMGHLGPITVELHRTPEGQLRIDFQATTVEAQQLLTDHMSDLTSRLEARGLALQEVVVRLPDQPTFRWEPPGASQREFQSGSERERQGRSALEETTKDDE
ncbi:MAG: flagellar hook-length control protein FliK [Acidobacteria bacterium]|nr:flagellar hook-length control protein FliK [Acidobacteriota bacterium]MDW7984562.1 flagellar hook-length control protein FliK [Acidobacteriota bacterium]